MSLALASVLLMQKKTKKVNQESYLQLLSLLDNIYQQVFPEGFQFTLKKKDADIRIFKK